MSAPRGETRPGSAGAGLAARSVDDVLAALASAEPVPGGGAAAALAGALAAALVAMVGRVTARREPDAPTSAEIAADADALRTRLLALAVQDGDAYSSVVAARRLPPEERDAALAAALGRATEVPLALAAACRDALTLCDRVVGAARASTLSDLRVAAILAQAAFDAASATARANLGDTTDAAYAGTAEDRLRALTGDARALGERVEIAIDRRSRQRA